MGKKNTLSAENNLSPKENTAIDRRVIASSLLAIFAMLLHSWVDNYLTHNPKAPSDIISRWRNISFFLIFLRWMVDGVLQRSVFSPKRESLPQLRKGLILRDILSIILLAIVVFPAIYYSPIPEETSRLISSIGNLSKTTINLIADSVTILVSGLSGYIGNIVVGILSNLATDLLKSVFRKKNMVNAGESSHINNNKKKDKKKRKK